ncbi:5'-nucleotidase C-terminal domain-containing protein [Haloferax sp. AB510]|uniref:5'-nucleotidase C-terminal domain-containing protein n=1 Tax=Haloferax sp. AB510 TaxID=2934172 RepID=UPI00209BDD8A|nr:5'-nucleotidase C-terminal domain-containing protein [Haloferax sp. AB510]MCO8265112.1 5'-nucleotidase C-terminal domain-containing protein [Haloferax sp. AB510]
MLVLTTATFPAGAAGVAAGEDASALDSNVQSAMNASAPAAVTITELQSNTSDGDASAYAGQFVNVTGTVTATNADGFFLQNASAADVRHSAVYVYAGGSSDATPGDEVRVDAPVTEYYGLTQLDLTNDSASLSTTGSGSVPEATALATENVSREAYESVLVSVRDVEVTATPGQYGEWAVTDGSGPVAIDDVTTGDDTTPSEVGSTADAIEGPVFYSFEEYKVQPTSVTNLTAPAGGDDGDAGNDTAGANATTISLVGFNDIGKAAAGSGDDKLGRMITLINRERANASGPVFVAGGGDELSPHALRNYDGLAHGYEPPVTAMNLIDPDAEVVQNHELDYDEDAGTNDFAVFEAIANESTYPWLLANVVDEETGENLPGTQNYTVVERGGVTVGFFGLTDEAINAKTDGVIERNGYTVVDPTTAAQRTVDTLRNEEDVDVVVALAPVGIPDSKDLARNVDGIDALVSGDDQQRYPPQTTNGVLIGETTGKANAIMRMELTVDNGSVTDASGELVDVTTDIPRNDSWQTYINPLREDYLNTELATAVMPEHTGVGSSYTDDSATGHLVTDGVRGYTGADVAVTNAGGIRDTLYPSEYGAGEEFNITRGMVTSTLSFGNHIVVVEVTGAELREVVKSQITPLEMDNQYGTQTQQQVSGVTFEWVPHSDSSSPGEGDATIRDLTVNGEPVNDSATYTLATNSYIADGGSGYPLADKPRVAVLNETTMADGVIGSLQNRSTIAAAEVDTESDDRMRRVDTAVDADAVDVTSGDSQTTVTIDAPSRVTGVSGTAAFADRNGGYVETTNVAYDDASGTVTVSVPTSDLDAFESSVTAPGSGVDLYVDYTDSAYSSQYENFGSAVLNADLDGEATTPDPTPEPADGVALGVGSDGQPVPLGDTRTFDITASDAASGVGAYELTLTVGDSSVARITGVQFPDEPGFSAVNVSDDGRTVHIEAAGIDAADANDSQVLATVTVEGVALGGSTALELTPTATYDPDGTAYAVSNIDNRPVSVEPGDLTGNGRAMADHDGDGTFEDVNGDGSVDVVDAQALFVNRDAEPVQSSSPAFDLNDDGRVDVGDVQRLFASTDA